MRRVSSLALVSVLIACSDNATPPAPSAAPMHPPGASTLALDGAGATFPYPLYSKWVAEYQKVTPNLTINYQSIGSGGGIRQITEKTVDFGASDAPMTDEELSKAPGELVHIPTTLGAVVLTYNVPGVATGLKLTPEAIAGIFLGTVTKWSDAKIASANPGTKLPDDAITVAARSDGSGTTNVFTTYLSTISNEWKTKVGAGKSVKWPVGNGGKGNEGVTGLVKTTPGAIGYVELAYALQNKLPVAELRNKAGKFVTATVDSIAAAAAATIGSTPEDLRVSIVDAPGDASYPIAAYTYILVYADSADRTRSEALAKFLWWAIHDGQKFGPPLNYATLPATVVAKDEAKLKALTAAGSPLLSGL